MAIANLTNNPSQVDTGNDSIVIVRNLDAVRGGRTLDVTGYTPAVIPAGHLVIVETATGQYKPMPLTAGGDAYAALPAGHTFAGVTINSVETVKPFTGILTQGTVNPEAAPFAIPAEAVTALSNIQFRAD